MDRAHRRDAQRHHAVGVTMARAKKNITVEGFEELDRALQSVGDRAGGILLHNAVEKASQPIVEEAQRLAPKKTGALADGIHAESTRFKVGQAQFDISYNKKQW